MLLVSQIPSLAFFFKKKIPVSLFFPVIATFPIEPGLFTCLSICEQRQNARCTWTIEGPGLLMDVSYMLKRGWTLITQLTAAF